MNNEIGVWVKASDELPNDDKIYSCKCINEMRRQLGEFYQLSSCGSDGNWSCETKFIKVVEWLRPLPSHVPISVERLEALEKCAKMLKVIIPSAEDGYKLHVKNACHSEFLKEEREELYEAKQALTNLNKQ